MLKGVLDQGPEKNYFFVLFMMGISLHLASIFFCQPWNNPPDLRKFQF